MQTPRTLIFLTLTALSLTGHARAEDRQGPDGGHIRMPGAIHTEFVKEKEGLRIYLIEINWTNPSSYKWPHKIEVPQDAMPGHSGH